MSCVHDTSSRLNALPAAPPNSGIILISEDPFVASFLTVILKRKGYRAMPVESARGVDMVRTGEVSARLVITNTPEVFLPVADRIRLLYLAADPDPALTTRFPACRAIRKPFRNDEFLAAVDQLAGSVV